MYSNNQQARTVVTGLLIAGISLAILALPLAFFAPESILYYIPVLMCSLGLWHIKRTGDVVTGALMTISVSYMVVTYIILRSGGIYSVHIASLYILLMTGFWVSRQVGHYLTLAHLLVIFLIYLATDTDGDTIINGSGADKEFALVFRWVLCLFFALFFSFTQQAQEELKDDLRRKQMMEMEVLKKRLRKKRRLIEDMRKTIARDFHDETGNILSSISYQANLLKLRIDENSDLIPAIDLINRNCEELMASSRDFLWSLNHESDNPMVVFDHLTDFGQNYFNQFEIAFFANSLGDGFHDLLRMDPYASRNLILIFKEAMTNVVKHSGATHVKLEMHRHDDTVKILLKDNGRWKDADPSHAHYGLTNMEARAKKNNIGFRMKADQLGTCVELIIPITIKTETLKNELL